MQSLRHGLLTRSVRLHQRPRILECRRNYVGPLGWFQKFQKKFVPTKKKELSEEERIAARQEAPEGQTSIFETVAPTARQALKQEIPYMIKRPKKPRPTTHKYSTSVFKISHRKLNMLGRQISGKPIDYAILQMQFSEKRASSRVMNMLATARDHAVRYKKLKKSKLIVGEAWVTKGPKRGQQFDIRGRGHIGVRVGPSAQLHVVMKEGKTIEQKKADEKARKLKKIVSASLVREDKPIRVPTSGGWAW